LGSLTITPVKKARAAAQTVSAEEAAGFVKPGMWLDYGVALPA
jgi:hypothetical protein